MEVQRPIIDRDELLKRFLRYVRIDTQASFDSPEYPSSPGQRILGALLVNELRAMGVKDARQDEYGMVWGTVPGTVKHSCPVIALNAHLDTSPEAPGANVKPQVIDRYAGGDIRLPGDPSQVISVADSPELVELVGKTLVTTDGTTLLGGDDKAGVAVIMQAVATWMSDPRHLRGDIRILFTCDEELGHGVQYVDVPALQAEACYTLDGSGANAIDTETFSADLATVTFRGVNIHPSIGKGKMVNAIRAAGYFVAELPMEHAPETTDGRDGFLHPYVIHGEVDRAELKILLRDFETPRLTDQAKWLREIADRTMSHFPGCHCDVQITTQYRNMREGLANRPEVVAKAVEAHRRLGRTPREEAVRGGTDGSRFTELGLPTPNLSSGQHNLHSRLEFVCLDEMVQATEVILALAAVWTETS